MSNKESQESTREWLKAIKIFYTVSSWIIFPVVFAIFFGNWMDDKYQTDPIFSLTSVGIAFIITCVGIVREAQKIIKNLK